MLICLRVDINDAAGASVEERLVVVAVRAPAGDRRSRQQAVLATDEAVRLFLAARVRRVQRIARDVAARMASTEHALTQHLERLSKTRERQEALFPERRRDAEARPIDETCAWDPELHRAALECSRHVELGKPALEWIWVA
jgi:hypothetical protein